MTSLGGGIYSYAQYLGPGWYQWKAVVTGSWDAIGDDFRSINANNTWFEVTAAKPWAIFYVNALAGTEKVETSATSTSQNQVPEPVTMILLGLGLMGVAGMRRTIHK